MNLTTKDIDSGNEFVSPYIRYGVQEIQITGVEAFTSPNEYPGLKFTAEGYPEEKLDGESPKMDSTFWLTERAIKHTLGTLANIADALGVRKELDAVDLDNTEEYAEAITPILRGKFFRALLTGKEIEASEEGKSNWFKSQLPLYVKCESLDVTETRLVFDAQKHLERLEIPTTEEMAEEATNDDMPF